ncbi:MAG: fimbrillin family protein [Dysgonomonas sp.]
MKNKLVLSGLYFLFMHNNILSNFTAFLLITFFLASCEDNDYFFEKGKIPLKLSAQIYDSYTSDKIDKMSFDENDSIGIYLVDYSNGIPQKIGSINNFMNSHYIYTGSYWHSNTGENLYLTDNNTVADLYAYYPYDYGMSREASKRDLSAYPFSISADQRSSISTNDFLWVKYTSVSVARTNVALIFKHLMSKIIVNVRFDTELADSNSLYIHNVKKDGFIDMNTGNVVHTANNYIITPFVEKTTTQNFNQTYSAIIMPQYLEIGTSLFSIETDGKLYTFQLDSGLTIEQGTSYTFNLIVGNANSDNYTKVYKNSITLYSKSRY